MNSGFDIILNCLVAHLARQGSRRITRQVNEVSGYYLVEVSSSFPRVMPLSAWNGTYKSGRRCTWRWNPPRYCPAKIRLVSRGANPIDTFDVIGIFSLSSSFALYYIFVSVPLSRTGYTIYCPALVVYAPSHLNWYFFFPLTYPIFLSPSLKEYQDSFRLVWLRQFISRLAAGLITFWKLSSF